MTKAPLVESKRRSRQMQIYLTPEEAEALDGFTRAEGITRSQLIGQLALRWRKGQLFLLCEATLSALVTATEERIMTKVKRWATTAVRDELYKQGFTLTPHDK